MIRWSQYYLFTTREVPNDAEVVSHELMVRAGHDQEGRRRHLLLPAVRLALVSQAGGDRPPRDERGGRDRARHAGDPARRALAGVRTLAALRQGAAAHPRPPRPRVLLRADPRGGGDRHRPSRRQELPAAAVQPLPDPDQVPRRDPAPLRPDARPRVPDEGRLLLLGDRAVARRGLRGDVRGVLPDLRGLPARVHGGRGRHRHDRRLVVPRVHGHRGDRRERGRALRGLRLRRQRREGGARGLDRARAEGLRSDAARSTPRAGPASPRWRSSSASRPRTWSRR